ncbi:gamma-glutamylcyclotransferase family protein [Effusibacillus pohliae]|uniref:gamma-glutamylcyclotransferase family protein n=1 Tax=Effusibacillus pohliae TaxID=232270 RepID=UPI00036C3F04|nr:gamma-glutamylcyclotransferase family protein [Effusibacillus pohliae]
MHYVFVYGTLRSGQKYHSLVKKFVVTVKPAFVQGRLYHLREGYPALVLARDLPRAEADGPQPAGGDNGRTVRVAVAVTRVRGDLLGFADLKPVLPILDELEDYYGPGDPRNLYERVTVWAAAGGGRRVRSLVYAFPSGKLGWLERHAIPIPGGDWVKWKAGR